MSWFRYHEKFHATKIIPCHILGGHKILFRNTNLELLSNAIICTTYFTVYFLCLTSPTRHDSTIKARAPTHKMAITVAYSTSRSTRMLAEDTSGPLKERELWPHYYCVAWASLRLKSPATWLFIQQGVQANKKGNFKDPYFRPFVKWIHLCPVDSPHKGSVNSVVVSVSWRHPIRSYTA